MKEFLTKLNQRIARLTSRVKIESGNINEPFSQNKNIKKIRVKNNGGSCITEYFSLCGFQSSPSNDSLGIIMSISARTDDTIAILYSPIDKFSNDDTAIFNTQNNDVNIVLKKDGTISINSKNKIEIKAENDINVISSSGIINLGESGENIARKGDQIQVTTDTGTWTGQITTGGNNKSL